MSKGQTNRPCKHTCKKKKIVTSSNSRIFILSFNQWYVIKYLQDNRVHGMSIDINICSLEFLCG